MLKTKKLAEDHMKPSGRSITPPEVIEALEERKDDMITEIPIYPHNKRKEMYSREEIARTDALNEAKRVAYHQHYMNNLATHNLPATK